MRFWFVVVLVGIMGRSWGLYDYRVAIFDFTEKKIYSKINKGNDNSLDSSISTSIKETSGYFSRPCIILKYGDSQTDSEQNNIIILRPFDTSNIQDLLVSLQNLLQRKKLTQPIEIFKVLYDHKCFTQNENNERLFGTFASAQAEDSVVFNLNTNFSNENKESDTNLPLMGDDDFKAVQSVKDDFTQELLSKFNKTNQVLLDIKTQVLALQNEKKVDPWLKSLGHVYADPNQHRNLGERFWYLHKINSLDKNKIKQINLNFRQIENKGKIVDYGFIIEIIDNTDNTSTMDTCPYSFIELFHVLSVLNKTFTTESEKQKICLQFEKYTETIQKRIDIQSGLNLFRRAFNDYAKHNQNLNQRNAKLYDVFNKEYSMIDKTVKSAALQLSIAVTQTILPPANMWPVFKLDTHKATETDHDKGALPEESSKPAGTETEIKEVHLSEIPRSHLPMRPTRRLARRASAPFTARSVAGFSGVASAVGPSGSIALVTRADESTDQHIIGKHGKPFDLMETTLSCQRLNYTKEEEKTLLNTLLIRHTLTDTQKAQMCILHEALKQIHQQSKVNVFYNIGSKILIILDIKHTKLYMWNLAAQSKSIDGNKEEGWFLGTVKLEEQHDLATAPLLHHGSDNLLISFRGNTVNIQWRVLSRLTRLLTGKYHFNCLLNRISYDTTIKSLACF